MNAMFQSARGQKLHAHADAEEGFGAAVHTFADRLDHPINLAEALHAIGKGALPGQYQAVSLRYCIRLAGDENTHIEAGLRDNMLESLGCGSQIARSVIDNGDGLRHKISFTIKMCLMYAINREKQTMNIGFYEWEKADAAARERIMRRSTGEMADVSEKVRPILEAVRTRGDDAIREYAAQFDGAALASLKVAEAEFIEAERTLDPAVKQAIDRCARNVRKFHEEQMRRVEPDWMMEIEPGVFAGEKVTPVSSVGIYVPGGKNQFPSAMYMLCIPAVLAGVPRIAVATPPRRDGSIGNALLYAARLSGVTDIYKVGGAVAMAAFAYGTQTIPAVKKVVGPCSLYGATAKQLLNGIIDAGMPAGPSESIVLCDDSANPHNTVLDLINEAEHGPDSAGLLVTHDRALAEYVRDHLPAAVNDLPEPQRGWMETNLSLYSGIILTRLLDESIAFANAYAPEHLLLKVRDTDAVLDRLHNAGEILIGEDSVFSLGNYGTGVNHVLPTGGMAHSYSCTSVWDFLKRTSLSRVTPAGRKALSEDVGILTDYEGFPGHGNALRQRA